MINLLLVGTISPHYINNDLNKTIMAHLQLTTDFETYLYNLVDGTIENVIFARDYIIVSTNIDNYKIYYNEIK